MIFNTNQFFLEPEEIEAVKEYRAKKAEGAKLVVVTPSEFSMVQNERDRLDWYEKWRNVLHPPNTETAKRARKAREWEAEVQRTLSQHGITRQQFQKIVGARL